MSVEELTQKTLRVLIVDDNDADRMVYKRFIGRFPGYEKIFLERDSGADGFIAYEQEGIDCILVDLHLPDMTGLEFLAEFKNRFGENACPIVMLTGQGSEEEAVTAMKEGAHDYLSKIRLTPENLNRAIDNAIEKVSLHQRLEKQRLDLEVKNHQLQVMKNHLEKLVDERTRDLIVTNERLLVEIEERRKAEQQVNDSAKFNRMIMDAVPVFIAYVDDNDCYRFANRQYEMAFDQKEENLLGKTITEHLGNAFIKERREALYGTKQDFEYTHPYPSGYSPTYNIVLTPHKLPNGDVQGYFMAGRDISERKAAEEALITHAQLIDQSLNAIISTTPEGYIRTWNEGAERIFLFPFHEAVGNHISIIFKDHDKSSFDKYIREPLHQHEQMESELVLVNRKEEDVYIHALFSLLQDIEGNIAGFVGYYLDNTQMMKAEKSLIETEAKFSALFRDAATGIVISDLEGTIRDCNPAFTRIVGLDHNCVLGNSFRHFQDDADHSEDDEFYEACLRGERSSYRIDCQLKNEDGQTIWASITTSIILDKDQVPQFVVRMVEDISKNKEAEETIHAQLEEKQVLLREIHHRVKNNLQVIQSLLRMQGREAQGSSIEPMLVESQNRIRSIALIHEQLYKQDNFSEIDFAHYLNLLLRQLSRTFGLDRRPVRSKVDFRDISLSLTKAIPCALIVNELVTNSLKYAFPDKNDGEIIIQAHTNEDEELVLTVRDNGIGFPENIDIETSETLGLKIVRTLTRQIGGRMQVGNNDGAQFILTFEP